MFPGLFKTVIDQRELKLARKYFGLHPLLLSCVYC